MKTRQERRAEARKTNTAFEPQYKGRVITKAEYDEETKANKARLKQLAETGLTK